MDEIEFKSLIEEYKMCREDASKLESQIWKAASIFGLSSAAGLVLKLKPEVVSKDQFYTISAIAILMITALLVWWRLSRLWWSIQHIKYKRMNTLETKLGFKQNSAISCIDNIVMINIHSDQIESTVRNFHKWCYN